MQPGVSPARMKHDPCGSAGFGLEARRLAFDVQASALMPREAKSTRTEKPKRSSTQRTASSRARSAKADGQRSTAAPAKQGASKKKRRKDIGEVRRASNGRAAPSGAALKDSRGGNGSQAAAAPRKRRAPVDKAAASPSQRKAPASRRTTARTGKRAKSVANKRAATRSAKARPAAGRKWSAAVTQSSDALDLQPGVFTQQSARAVATSLKRSAERSKRRKGTPYQSAVSMLNFYLNRSGTNLSPARRRKLERAQDELKVLFNKPKAA
jgi:uncharacterized protein DUF3175